MLPRTRLAAFAVSLLLAAGCTAPTPSHFTRLWLQGETGVPIIGTSTEDGVLVLAEPTYEVGTMFEIQFPVGNSLVRDWGRIDRLNDNLAVVRPVTARLREGRIATALPQPGEQLYLAMRDERDEPVMQPVTAWLDGRFGDWIIVPERDPEQIARDYRGTGLYVDRTGKWQIVGVLAGLLAQDESDPKGQTALGYIGLLELSRILPDRIEYLQHDVKPLRPDFEFGVPLQSGDIDLTPPEKPVDPTAVPPATPPATPSTTPAPAGAPAPAPASGTSPKPAPGPAPGASPAPTPKPGVSPSPAPAPAPSPAPAPKPAPAPAPDAGSGGAPPHG